MKFTINREVWRCGRNGKQGYAHGLGGTCLLNEQGYMCCLGQVSKQLYDISNEALLFTTTPAELLFDNDKLKSSFLAERGRGTPIPAFIYHNSEISEKAMSINDDSIIPLSEKEDLLKALFEENGHELEFVGEYNAKQD